MRLHPLYGVSTRTLVAALRRTRSLPLRQPGRLFLILLSSLLRSPFAAIERLALEHPIARARFSQPPIIIVGHWRTGTSFLHHLLSRGNFAFLNPLVAGIPSEEMLLGVAVRPLLSTLLPSDRLIDSMPVRPESPQEDEIALANMTHLAFHHGLYFPTQLQRVIDESLFFQGEEGSRGKWCDAFRTFAGKLSIRNSEKQLLLKNPAHTCRIEIIKDVLPSAKFIHMVRNPYEVYPSMINFYEKLLCWLALERYDRLDLDPILFSTYTRMMTKLHEDASCLPARQFVEVRFEQLVKDPMGVIRGIYEQLELDDFEAASGSFETYISSVRGYKRNAYTYTPEMFRSVELHWAQWIRLWGYERPEISG